VTDLMTNEHTARRGTFGEISARPLAIYAEELSSLIRKERGSAKRLPATIRSWSTSLKRCVS
jgi:hypothetical protein